MIDNKKTTLFTEKNLLDLRNNILKNKMLLPVIKDNKHKPQVPNIPGLDFVLARVARITKQKIAFYDQYSYNIKRNYVPLFYSYSQYYFYFVETRREYSKKEKDFWESSCMPLFLKILLSDCNEIFITTLLQANPLFDKKIEDFVHWFFNEMVAESMCPFRDYMFDLSLAAYLHVLYCLYGFKFDTNTLVIICHVASDLNINNLDAPYSVCKDFLYKKYILKKA